MPDKNRKSIRMPHFPFDVDGDNLIVVVVGSRKECEDAMQKRLKQLDDGTHFYFEPYRDDAIRYLASDGVRVLMQYEFYLTPDDSLKIQGHQYDMWMVEGTARSHPKFHKFMEDLERTITNLEDPH